MCGGFRLAVLVLPGRSVHGMQAGRLRGRQCRRHRRQPAGKDGAQNGEREEDLSHAGRDRRARAVMQAVSTLAAARPIR